MFRVLLKKQFAELLEMYFPKKTKKSKAGTRSKWLVLLFVFLYISIAFGLGAMMWPMCDAFVPLGLDWLYFLLVYAMGLVVGLVGSVFSTYSALYKAKDNEFLLSMPIKPRQLLLSRMVGVFFTGFAFVCIACLPAIVVYFILFGVRFSVVVGCLVGILSLGMTVLAFSCFFGWLVALGSSVTRNKSVATVLSSLLLLGAYYFFYFRISDIIQYLIENALAVGGKIEKNALLFKRIGEGFTGSPVGMAIMLGIGIVLFALTLFVIVKSFEHLLTVNRGAKQAVYRRTALKQSSLTAALVRKEFRHFSQSAAYMLNCGLGLIFLIGGTVFLLIRFTAARNLIDGIFRTIDTELGPDYAHLRDLIVFAPALLVGLISSMNPISAPSISIEGPSMWLLRSLPARDKEIFVSKQALHLILALPPSLLAAAVMNLIVRASALKFVTNLLFVAACVFLLSAAGLALSLIKPNLNWTNETEAVKTGLPVLITLLGGMALPIALGVACYFVGPYFDLTPWLWLLPAAGAALINCWIFKKGGKKLAELG